MADLQEAINILLIARGVTPISDPDSGHPDVEAARSILERHKRGVLSKQWWFNTESDVTLSPNSEGYIHLPAGVIGLDEDSDNIVMQGKLYNMTDRTNIFTDPVEDLTLIYNRAWEDLPIQAFDYVAALAKEEFVRTLESRTISAAAEADINRTYSILQITDYRFKDVGKQSGNPLMLKFQQKMIQR